MCKNNSAQKLLVDQFLDDAGLNNTVKNIAFTLSWPQNDCDTDLWVVDPKGDIINYDNELSVSGGRYEFDADGSNEMNVENVSWSVAIDGKGRLTKGFVC